MIAHLKPRLDGYARVGCNWMVSRARVAPRMLLVGGALIGAAHLTAPPASAQSGLVAAYSFNEGSGNSVGDLSPSNNDGAIDSATWTTSGRYGGALVFNGSSAVVNIPNSRSLRLTSAMTLEAWVRPTSVASEWRDVIYKGNDNYYLMAMSDASSRPAAGGKFGSSSASNVFAPSPLVANTWTHLAATYDGSTLKLYVNGVLASSGARSGSMATSNNPLQIGGDRIFGQYFAGTIDEVRVYNVALTAAQVQADMNTPLGSGTPAPTPSPSADLTITKTHAGGFTQGQTGAAYTVTVKNSGGGPSSGTVSVRDTLPAGLAGTAISGSGWTCTVSTLTCTRSDALAAGASYPAVTVTVNVSASAPSSVTNTATVSGGGESSTGNDSASDVTAIAPSSSQTPLPGDGLVAAYSFNEGGGSSVNDSSSSANRGTIANATWTAAGRFGAALNFNGSSAVVNIPSSASLRLTSGMTLEAWVKPTSVASQWRDVIYKGDDNYYLMGMSDTSSRPAVGGKFSSTSFSSSNVFGPSPLAVNTWTHLAATYDGSMVKLYVNGALVSSGARSGTLQGSDNPLQLGGDSIFGQYFAGTIDEVRVYNVALTAAQVQADMNTPVASPTSAAPLPPPPPPSDTLAPTVAITAPAAGAQVSGTLNITANASDNVGVTSVSFLVDGVAVGSDTSAPYSVSWNTAAFTAGSHSVQAQARDAAGNVGSSAPVTVTTAQSNAGGMATFTASADDAFVDRYLLEIFTNGANVNTAVPAASADLGKPPVVNGQYSADISGTLGSLPAGTYVATVSAVAASGRARSAPSPSFTIAANAAASAGRPGLVSALAMSTASTTESSAPEAGSTAPIRRAGSNGTLWVTDASAHMVDAFDAATGDVLAAIPVGAKPVAVAAPNGIGKIYVADEDSDTVSVIDKATMTRVAVVTLPAPFGRKPHQLTGSADGSRVFVAESRSNVVDVIDTKTDEVITRFAAGQPGSTVRSAAPDASGQLLYALSHGDDVSQNALVAVAAATGRWQWMMPIPEQVGALTLEADGRTALVSVPEKNVLLVIDLERRMATGVVDLGAGNTPAAVRASTDGHVIVTLQAQQDRLGIVDAASNVRIVPIAGIAATASDRSDTGLLAYVAVAEAGGAGQTVIGLDPASGRVVRRFRLPGGGTASDVTFDPR